MSTPAEPGTIRASLAGRGPDLFQLGLYLEAVTRGSNPADVLAELHLAAVTISEMRGPWGHEPERHFTMTLTLEPASD